ncbi:MAG: hypothetical protein JW781_06440 [Deltaproteobacteria bacterium]|nr:hypothetical protein [Candidatus Anaeroferrophillacea bacterium]
MTRRTRQWLLGLGLIVTVLLIWWLHDYGPRAERLAAATAAGERERERNLMLTDRLARYTRRDEQQQAQDEKLDILAARLVPGASIEEVNTQVQQDIQRFLDEKGISLVSYNIKSPEKWREYRLGRIQFNLDTTTRGVAELLRFLDSYDRAVRVGGLNIRYQRRQDITLKVTLELDTLYLDKEQVQ